jgi:hypothetical protein
VHCAVCCISEDLYREDMKFCGCHIYILLNVCLCCNGMTLVIKTILIYYVSIMYDLDMCVYCFTS